MDAAELYELDREVAEKVMGWKWIRYGGDPRSTCDGTIEAFLVHPDDSILRDPRHKEREGMNTSSSERPERSKAERALNGVRSMAISDGWSNADMYEFIRLVEAEQDDLINATDSDETEPRP